jgi:hypothetical protein
MPLSLDSTAIAALALVAGAAILLDHFLGFKPVANEPPVIKPTIPYVGHILGLIRHGTLYYKKL